MASFYELMFTNIKLGLCLCLNTIFFFHFTYLRDSFMAYILICKYSLKHIIRINLLTYYFMGEFYITVIKV